MNKPKFTLALQYFDQFKKATNEKDKQFFYRESYVSKRKEQSEIYITKFDSSNICIDYFKNPDTSDGQKKTGYAKICVKNA